MNAQTTMKSVPKTPPEKGKFYIISTAAHGGSKVHGMEFANRDALRLNGVGAVFEPNGDPQQYQAKPHLVYDPKRGKLPRDLEAIGGKWIVSERLKIVLESVDPKGFAFVECDYTMPDGSAGPKRYLCGILRTLDAVDEEASNLKIRTGEYVNGKFYSVLMGRTRLAFKSDVIKHAHIFRTPYSYQVFCTRELHDVLRAAGFGLQPRSDGIRLDDAADY